MQQCKWSCLMNPTLINRDPINPISPFHPNRGLFHNNICPIHPISPFHLNRGPVHNNRGLIYPNQAPIQTASQIQLMNQRKSNF
ncbi:hypothetical protein ACOSP7_031573 [Xanthoceras sorbifolium]